MLASTSPGNGRQREAGAADAVRTGAHRVVDTPLAKSAVVGTAIGIAMRGYQPVAKI